MMRTPKQKGFTIVEMVVAIALLSLLTAAVTALMSGTISSERHVRSIEEVETQGNYALYQFAQAARNGRSITAPTALTGATSSSLTLASNVSTANPTVFGLSNGALQEKQGSAASTTLTSAAVTVTSLSFQNLTASSTKGTVRMAITLSHVNPSNRSDLSYTQTFYTSVTLR